MYNFSYENTYNKYSKIYLALADMAFMGIALLGGEMVVLAPPLVFQEHKRRRLGLCSLERVVCAQHGDNLLHSIFCFNRLITNFRAFPALLHPQMLCFSFV